MNPPNEFLASEQFFRQSLECFVALPGDTWVPRRPTAMGGISNRLRCTWLVFTGKADCLRWVRQ